MLWMNPHKYVVNFIWLQKKKILKKWEFIDLKTTNINTLESLVELLRILLSYSSYAFEFYYSFQFKEMLYPVMYYLYKKKNY